MNKFIAEIKDYIKNNHNGKSTIELSKEVNDLFGLKTKPDDIQNLKTRIKKKEGFIFAPARNDGCIKKGNTPSNKGKKWNEYMSKESQSKVMKTTFKKGNVPSNHRKIGEERINVDGYVEIKTREPNKWELKQRVLYKKYYGSIPKGNIVIFADNNKLNFRKENLIAISRKENLILNKKKLRFNSQDLTKSGIIIAKVIDKTNEKRKR